MVERTHIVELAPNVSIGTTVFSKAKGLAGQSFLLQVHGADGIEVKTGESYDQREGDYLWTFEPSRIGVCVADCTAILMTGIAPSQKRFVAAIHAGWRGSSKQILQKALKQWEGSRDLIAWLSPSICQNHYEVGREVKDAFEEEAHRFFKPQRKRDKFKLDLRGYQESLLEKYGIPWRGKRQCTFESLDLPSYRRDGSKRDSRLFCWAEIHR